MHDQLQNLMHSAQTAAGLVFSIAQAGSRAEALEKVTSLYQLLRMEAIQLYLFLERIGVIDFLC